MPCHIFNRFIVVELIFLREIYYMSLWETDKSSISTTISSFGNNEKKEKYKPPMWQHHLRHGSISEMSVACSDSLSVPQNHGVKIRNTGSVTYSRTGCCVVATPLPSRTERRSDQLAPNPLKEVCLSFTERLYVVIFDSYQHLGAIQPESVPYAKHRLYKNWKTCIIVTVGVPNTRLCPSIYHFQCRVCFLF